MIIYLARWTIFQPILLLIKVIMTCVGIHYMIKQRKSYKNGDYFKAIDNGGKALAFLLPSIII